jgi:hypothetical protein
MFKYISIILIITIVVIAWCAIVHSENNIVCLCILSIYGIYCINTIIGKSNSINKK